ncbi:MAG: MFS transporter [Crocinitomicaceae bacterium]|nr:MFS transporter [Crocinitomicaceae bacterium]
MSAIQAYFSTLKDYPREFWFLNVHVLLFFTSFNMLIPEMNDYITLLGGADKKWMILGLWTIAAAISRPISGKIADNISRKSVMFVGVTVSVIISFSYPWFATVAGFLFLRFLHGFSTGFQPTGATALIADIIPQGKRGEAMGIFGVTITLGFSLGMAIGNVVKKTFDMNGLFLTAGILGTISLLLILLVSEDKTVVQQNAKEKGYTTFWEKVIPKWDEIIGPEVVHPSIIMFVYANITGMYFLLIPDFSKHLGLENKGLFFVVNLFVVVVTRFAAGKLVDKVGAKRNIGVGLSVLMISCLITGSATTQTHFLLSSLIFGFGTAIISPAIMAWTADLANPVYKGRGMGTMFIMLELGFLSGNFFAQQFYLNDSENILRTFVFGAVLSAIALMYLILVARKSKTSYN